MSSRHVVLPKPRGINPSRFPVLTAPATLLSAALARCPLKSSKHATLTLLFATLTRNARVSSLLATLTKNIGGGGYLSLLFAFALRYFLTRLLLATYTHFSSFSR